MKTWHEIYKDRMNDDYLKHVSDKYDFLISELHNQKVNNFIEFGCGAGNITRLVKDIEVTPKNYYLLDHSLDMLELAKTNNPDIAHNTYQIDIVLMREFLQEMSKKINLPAYREDAVVFSHGVLEHFSDGDIVKIIDNGNLLSTKQLHYVPSSKYTTPSRGCERLLSAQEWSSLLSRLHGVSYKVTEHNDGKDLLIVISDNHIWRG